VLSDGQEYVQADFPADVSPSTLSHHMKRLRQAGVAWSRPEGTRCYVSLRADLEQRFPGLPGTVLAADEDQAPPLGAAADAGQAQPQATDADQGPPGPAAELQPSGT
jgi:hypothetical protein